MNVRVRVFTDTTGTAHTAIESDLEDEINDWLAATPGEFLAATQSESRHDKVSHLTVSVWYREQSTSPAD